MALIENMMKIRLKCGIRAKNGNPKKRNDDLFDSDLYLHVHSEKCAFQLRSANYHMQAGTSLLQAEPLVRLLPGSAH
jgi:hypothetical protein